MKKLVLVLVVVLMAVSLSAQAIQLGNFPVGNWLDHNYNAIWEFSANNIRVLYPNGVVAFDFSRNTIRNFRVFMDGTQPGISFDCPEAGRSYRFIKPLSGADLVMEIQREGEPSYSVTQQQWTGQLPVRAAPAAAGRIPNGTYEEQNPMYSRNAYEISGNTWKYYGGEWFSQMGNGTYTAQNGYLTFKTIHGDIHHEGKYTLAGNTLTIEDSVYIKK